MDPFIAAIGLIGLTWIAEIGAKWHRNPGEEK